MEYTGTEKNNFFSLMNRLINIANGYNDSKPNHSTIAKMNDLFWVKKILAPQNKQAEKLIEEWILKNRIVNKEQGSSHSLIIKSAAW